MDQHKAPLYEALVQRRTKGEASFHVPGHKFGAGLKAEAKHVLGPVMGIDYTEINGLDDLHHPESVILEAQQLAAACFGSEETHFLIGGSTVGNLAVLTTICSRGDLILVQRNAHKSVIHGLMLAGAWAVLLQPETDKVTGIASGVSMETVKMALEQYPEAKGVFLTNPNYYGMGFDLAPYADAVHKRGIPLLIDEAHGAHFGFHGKVPPSALSKGADAVIQSTHKMLSAMTMGAMLHVQGKRIDRRKLKQRLGMLQSSSPSYPLMASLDLARQRMAASGTRLIGEALQSLGLFRIRLKGLHRLRLLEAAPSSNAYDYIDSFKLTIYDCTGSWSGFQLQERLAELGIIPEMADDRYVLLVCSPDTTEGDLDRLAEALYLLDSDIQPTDKPASLPARPMGSTLIGEPVWMEWDTPSESDVLSIPLEHAVGRICAESVVPYPPGIPLLFPGEVIRPHVIEQIQRLAEAGARFQGTLQGKADCSILVKKSNGE